MNSVTRLLSRLFLTLAVLSIFGCGGGSSSSGGGTAPPVAQVSVVAIGDSIGNGFGIATGWPVFLADIIGAPVDNNSVTSEFTDFGVSIIEERLTTVQPTHVVILLGTNDAIRGSVPVAIANLQTMVDIARAQGVIPIVGTLPPITTSPSANARAAEISEGIRGLSGAVVAGVRAALGDGSGLIADGVHPNNAGQQRIADAFAAQF